MNFILDTRSLDDYLVETEEVDFSHLAVKELALVFQKGQSNMLPGIMESTPKRKGRYFNHDH